MFEQAGPLCLKTEVLVLTPLKMAKDHLLLSPLAEVRSREPGASPLLLPLACVRDTEFHVKAHHCEKQRNGKLTDCFLMLIGGEMVMKSIFSWGEKVVWISRHTGIKTGSCQVHQLRWELLTDQCWAIRKKMLECTLGVLL